jgi:FkbM family methyltransferase
MNSTGLICKVSTLFKQFSFFNAIRLMIVEVARRMFDPNGIVVYARTGEDRIVEYILQGANGGFYVDVGCNHPQLISNTMRLYKRGWVGICIDANGDLIREFKKVRPRDICVEAVVSNKVAEAEFIQCEDPALSSLAPLSGIPGHLAPAKGVKRTVHTQKLTAILERHDAPCRFELLSVDCEGHDCEVISSLDLERYRPRLIIVEIHYLDLEHVSENGLCRYLSKAGYKLCGYAGQNAYFIDSMEKS